MTITDLPALIALGRRVAHVHDTIVARHPVPRATMDGSGATQADLDVEADVIALLEAVLGDVTIVAEETVAAGGGEIRPGRSVRVFLDPIDGTSLFSAGTPGHAVTLAIEMDRRLTSGVVYVPHRGVLHVAARTAGRTRTCAVSSPAPYQPVANPAVVAITSALRRVDPRLDAAVRAAGYVPANLGSIARRMVEVANGEIGGVVKRVGATAGIPRLWGVAAGLLLCDAAGVQHAWDPLTGVLVAGEASTLTRLSGTGVFDPVLLPLDELWSSLTAYNGCHR